MLRGGELELPAEEGGDERSGFGVFDFGGVADAGFGAEGGGAEAAEAFDGAGADAGVVIGEPEAFFGAHGFVFGEEDESVFFVHGVVSDDGHDFGVAFFAQESSVASGFIVGDEGEDGFAFVLFAVVTVPLHGAAPAHVGSTDREAGVYGVEFAEGNDAGVVFFKGFDGDLGAAFFGAFEGEVVGGALRFPDAGAFFEKI